MDFSRSEGNSTPDDLRRKTADLEKRIESLEREQQRKQSALDQVLSVLEKQQLKQTRQASRIFEAQARLIEFERQLQEMLQSRIWRTLQFLGGIALRIYMTLRGRKPEPSHDCEGPDDSEPHGYARWIADCDATDQVRHLNIRYGTPPSVMVTVLMPLLDAENGFTPRAIESVAAQSYTNWELCLIGKRAHEFTQHMSHSHSELASRLKSIVDPDSAQVCRGESWRPPNAVENNWIAFLNPEDELSPHCFYELARASASNRAQAIYTDEDRIDELGRKEKPFFKPDWSPDLVLDHYPGNFLACRADLVHKTGSLGTECLRELRTSSLQTGRVVHIPKVLYHRRLTRKEVDPLPYLSKPFDISLHADVRVSIIIPSGGKLRALQENLKSLASTTHRNYEVVVVDNSRGKHIEQFVLRQRFDGAPARYLDCRDHRFNYSALNNLAARTCASPMLVFLNDDTSVVSPDWLDVMLGFATRADVGAVGAKLLYPDGRIQHAGIIMGLFGCCGHAFKGLDANRTHYFGLSDCVRNVSAVTGACLMLRSEVFLQAGGFNERNYPVSFNDVDLCLRLNELGYRVLYAPQAVLIHHEAHSRLPKHMIASAAEVQELQSRWGYMIEHDPFYNPNLSRTREDYSFGIAPDARAEDEAFFGAIDLE